jgi:hypothetical protein
MILKAKNWKDFKSWPVTINPYQCFHDFLLIDKCHCIILKETMNVSSQFIIHNQDLLEGGGARGPFGPNLKFMSKFQKIFVMRSSL